MVYAATITTPENTLQSAALDTELIVTKGLVWLIDINLPPGCAGLAHVQIFDGSYQLFPATPGESFHGDGVEKGFDDLYLKVAAPFVFNIKTWNLDQTWPHTISVRMGMASSDAEISRYMPGVAWDKLTEALADMSVIQEAQRAAQLESITKSLEGLQNG